MRWLNNLLSVFISGVRWVVVVRDLFDPAIRIGSHDITPSFLETRPHSCLPIFEPTPSGEGIYQAETRVKERALVKIA